LTPHWSSSIARHFPPAIVHADGDESVTVASRFGTLELARQVCYHPALQTHIMPGNSLLPPHHGIIITRGLQEWACLLPQELPFAAVARLLGWQTHEAHVLSDTTVRSLVRTHGQIIRLAEQGDVTALLQRDDLATIALQVVPHNQPRRRAGWPAALNVAVDTALAAEQVRPPDGISWADWERVLAARRADATCTTEDLRHVGPELDADQILVTVDEVLTRKPEPHRFWELRTARVVTADGYRYLSGGGAAFLQCLLVALLLALGTQRSLLLIADGARWIRVFFTETLGHLPDKTMLLDWYHLHQKCTEQCSRICCGKQAKARLLLRLYRRLWPGDVAAAVAILEAYRPKAKNAEVLDTFVAYLQAREAWIPNYRQRRIAQQYIGSGHVEKANDLIVARRQKGRVCSGVGVQAMRWRPYERSC
jgi:hypothetical protein